VLSILNGVSHTPFRNIPFTNNSCVRAEMAPVAIKGSVRKQSWMISRYYTRICLEGVMRHTAYPIQDSQCLGWDSNQTLQKYKLNMLQFGLNCSVWQLSHDLNLLLQLTFLDALCNDLNMKCLPWTDFLISHWKLLL
jgi:hypothetical protein